jgi:hypothetical protein
MPPSPKAPRGATIFDVLPDGTLTLTEVKVPKTRASAYDLTPVRIRNAADLLSAAAGCPPLAWHLHSLYDEARETHAAELARLLAADAAPLRRRKLAAQLHMLAREPEDGLADWMDSLSGRELQTILKSARAWLAAEPAWTTEEEHLPWRTSRSGAAFEYFRGWDPNDLIAIGVRIVEGEHPGSNYYAAELTRDPAVANSISALRGFGAWFRKTDG